MPKTASPTPKGLATARERPRPPGERRPEGPPRSSRRSLRGARGAADVRDEAVGAYDMGCESQSPRPASRRVDDRAPEPQAGLSSRGAGRWRSSLSSWQSCSSRPSCTDSTSKPLTYNTFINDVAQHKVQSANVDNCDGDDHRAPDERVSSTPPAARTRHRPGESALQKAERHGRPISTPSSSLLETALIYVLPIALIFGFLIWLNRRAQGQMSGIMSIGRSRAKLYTTERPRTTFSDVAGYQGVKQEISEVVDFLKSSARFRDIGARVPKGVLLVGPPGTGKTLLARAVAGEAGVPFLSVSGSDFMEMFVGVGASRVRDLFQTARKQAPAIIFVDEIDSIGRKRGAGLGGGHDEREQTLNQMLSEMDGFDPTEGVVIMAATNRPDILDPALLRPGRFDRQIVVPLPDLEERLPILQVHCRDKRVSEDVDLMIVARGTPGMSGAELANLVNEAALHAVRRGSQWIQMRDFDAARDRVLMGQPRESMALSPDEKERVAYHEGGHAVLAYVLPERRPVAQGEHHPDRHGARGHPAAACRGAPHLPARVHRGLARGADGRPGGREARLRRPLHRRERRPAAQHRARPQDGPGVGHVGPDRADGVGLAGDRLPRRGPHAHEGLLRGHEPRRRRGDRAHPPARRAGSRPGRSPSTGLASTPSPRRSSSTRRSTAGRSPGSSTRPSASPCTASPDGEVPDQARFASSLVGGGSPPPPAGQRELGHPASFALTSHALALVSTAAMIVSSTGWTHPAGAGRPAPTPRRLAPAPST